MNALDVSWSFLKASEWKEYERMLEQQRLRDEEQRQREAAASKVTTDATGQDPDAAERTEREESELSRKIREANEKTRQKIREANEKLKNRPHITWGGPEKQWGWLNGHLYLDLDGWAAKNPGGYTESISDRHQGGQ
tara:strand:+ start:72 stop:482 length:411 start_codon:yes stop_codon:yes gene_type:complete